MASKRLYDMLDIDEQIKQEVRSIWLSPWLFIIQLLGIALIAVSLYLLI